MPFVGGRGAVVEGRAVEVEEEAAGREVRLEGLVVAGREEGSLGGRELVGRAAGGARSVVVPVLGEVELGVPEETAGRGCVVAGRGVVLLDRGGGLEGRALVVAGLFSTAGVEVPFVVAAGLYLLSKAEKDNWFSSR